MDYQREYNVPTFAALFYVIHYACHNGIYFHLEYRGVEPELEAMSPFWAPFIHPSTSAFIGLGPIHVPDKVSTTVWKWCGMVMCTFNNRLLLKKVCSDFLSYCRAGGESFLPRIINGNENGSIALDCRQSLEWHPSSAPKKEFRATCSAEKVMTAFLVVIMCDQTIKLRSVGSNS